MDIVQQAKWNLGAASCSFEQRQILDWITSQLPLVYGEPDCEPLPECLRDLVATLGAGEPSAGTTEVDLSQRTPRDPPGRRGGAVLP
jgi:hypothetical protein